MNISELFSVFKQIEETSSRLVITSLLANLFSRLNNDEIGEVVYLTQGRICPIFTHKEFGLGEKLLIKGIINGFQIDKKLFYDEYHKQGDVGRTIEIFRSRINTIEENDISINSLFERLSTLAEYEGKGSQDSKLSGFMSLLRAADPLSCRYLVRIPTNTLRLGFSDMTILDALSVMITGTKSGRSEIERAYNVRPDLGFIAKTLKEKELVGLKNIQPLIGTPIRMMLAERAGSSEEVIKNAGLCYVEPKYDGLRLQAHVDKKNNKVFLFSRGLENVTLMYPDICANLLKSVQVDTAILEGEAVGYDNVTKQMLPFQETVQRKRKYDIDQKQHEIPLKYYVFDILFLNSRSILTENFKERRKKLDKCIKENTSEVIKTQTTTCKTIQEVEKEFNLSVKNGFEGIMVKKQDAIYQAGARGWSWIKYKKSYAEKVADTIDCVVMGYDLGKGKRTGFGIGAFLVGVFDADKERFVTAAKIGTGLTDDEWKELKKRSGKLITKIIPNNYFVKKEMKVDSWLKPSIIVEIRVDEITISDMHTAGLAFRFPRLERFRDDKSLNEITTLTEVKNLYSQSRENK